MVKQPKILQSIIDQEGLPKIAMKVKTLTEDLLKQGDTANIEESLVNFDKLT